jgi:hypothetical protein
MSSRRSHSQGPWRKSSWSGVSGDCIEVAGLADGDSIRVRDSKDPGGPTLNFAASKWNAFIGGIRNDEVQRKSRIQ